MGQANRGPVGRHKVRQSRGQAVARPGVDWASGNPQAPGGAGQAIERGFSVEGGADRGEVKGWAAAYEAGEQGR